MKDQQKLYMPKEFVTASTESTVTASRNEVLAVDVCPQCGGTMRVMSANGHNCYACIECRIVLPILA